MAAKVPSHLLGVFRRTDDANVVGKEGERRFSRSCLQQASLSLVSFCVAPARGTTRSVSIEDRGELVDKGSSHCSLCPGEIMALNLLK